MKKQMAVYARKRRILEGREWRIEIEDIVVRVMATAEKYAMVRIKGCTPFVVSTKDLTMIE